MARPPRTCSHVPGDHNDPRRCPATTTHRSGLCDNHLTLQRAHSRDRSPRDPNQNRWYSSEAWRELRATQLQRHPHCTCGPDCCPQGCTSPATEVDHIDGNWRNNATSNLRTLSKSCHSRKTGRDHGFRERGETPQATPAPRARVRSVEL